MKHTAQIEWVSGSVPETDATKLISVKEGELTFVTTGAFYSEDEGSGPYWHYENGKEVPFGQAEVVAWANMPPPGGCITTGELNILHVKAGVRYWEDCSVNGVQDTDGTLIPFREGDDWCPKIDIDRGVVLGWPEDLEAVIHYKVCDAGEYWLGTEIERLWKYAGDYVPSDYLCHGGQGWGDYIILEIHGGGSIYGFRKPVFDAQNWVKE